jgi:hypothetical protein
VFIPQGGGDNFNKPFLLTTVGIEKWTFNTGQNKYAAQFLLHREEVANYIQRTLADEGYLVAQRIRSGTKQSIPLPLPVDPNDPDKEDLEAIRTKDVKTVAKRRQKLKESLLKGYATVYAQCSQGLQDKLKVSKDWETVQQEQLLHDLISQVERICVGFDDHKQDVFNLVQVLKTLFLYTQGNKESMEEYGCNLRSLWDTVEAFGGSPGIHKGLTDALLTPVTSMEGVPLAAQQKKAEEDSSKAVKAALLISGADRRRYGVLKDALANNYLLGNNQYPDTYNKAFRVLANYQVTKTGVPYRASPADTGVAFLQQGGKEAKEAVAYMEARETRAKEARPREAGTTSVP